MILEQVRQCGRCIGFGCGFTAEFSKLEVPPETLPKLTNTGAAMKCESMTLNQPDTCKCCNGMGFHRKN